MPAEATRRWWKRLWVALVALGAVFMFFRWFEHSQVYHPSRSHDAAGGDLGRAWEDVYITTTDGVRLNGWFFPAQADSPRARIAILHCHGNAGNISHRLQYYSLFLELGVAVLGIDYRGYGKSEGRPSEEGTYQDAQAAFRWLKQRGIEKVVAFGESLGGGIVSELALREPVDGIVLASTFTSVPDLGAELFPLLPVKWLASIHYDSVAKLPRLKVPVLILHSREDTLVRYSHAERNFAAAREPKFLVETLGDHNDQPESSPSRYKEGLERLLKLVEQAPRLDGGIEVK